MDRDHAVPYDGVTTALQKIVDAGRTRLVIVTGRDAREVNPLLGLVCGIRCGNSLEPHWPAHGANRPTTLHYEGRRNDDIRKERPNWQLFRDGSPGGESPHQVMDRADRVVKRIRATNDDVLVFSSGHFLRVLATRWLLVSITRLARCLTLTPASLSILGYEDSHWQPVIRVWNDTHHPVTEVKQTALLKAV